MHFNYGLQSDGFTMIANKTRKEKILDDISIAISQYQLDLGHWKDRLSAQQ